MGAARLVRLLAGSLAATAVVVGALVCLAIALAVILFGAGVGGALALYFVIWWILLFAVLPFGVQSQAETGEVVKGSEPGAPSIPALREKAIWTSLLAAVVFIAAVAVLPLAGL